MDTNVDRLVCGKDGKPLYFSKENTSNGSIGTVDVFYPQMPLLLLESPALTRATLAPIMIYASSGKWPYEYAPHDVGTYPWGNGQTYNYRANLPVDRQPKEDAARMPVEECGNMLISLCAYTQRSGDVSLAGEYWETVAKWVRYLEKFGFDPCHLPLCGRDARPQPVPRLALDEQWPRAWFSRPQRDRRRVHADARGRMEMTADEPQNFHQNFYLGAG